MSNTRRISAILTVTIVALLIPSAALAYQAPLPKVPTGPFLSAAGHYQEVKPRSITLTGDGSAYLGGRTGHYATGGPHRAANFGHLRWRTYNYTQADATGVEWAKFGPGPLSIDRFHIDATARLHFYDVENGVFTKLTLRLHFTHNMVIKRLIGKTRTYHFNYRTNAGY